MPVLRVSPIWMMAAALVLLPSVAVEALKDPLPAAMAAARMAKMAIINRIGPRAIPAFD